MAQHHRKRRSHFHLKGLQDSHIHVHSFGAMLNSLQVRGVESINELQEKLSEFAANRANKGIPKER